MKLKDLILDLVFLIAATLGIWAFAASKAHGQSLQLRCELQDGAMYTATLDEQRQWGMLLGKPVGRAQDGYILGGAVREWTRVKTSTAGGIARVVIEVSNCATNIDAVTGHPGATYYRSISLNAIDCKYIMRTPRVPQPWLVAPGEHVFLSGKLFLRSMVVYWGKVTEREARLALDYVPALDLSKPVFPQQCMLPLGINVAAMEVIWSAKYKRLQAVLMSGSAGPEHDIRQPVLRDQKTGAAVPEHPPGNLTISYEPGGGGIYFIEGWEQAPSRCLYAVEIAYLYAERMIFVRNRSDGTRITTEQCRQSFTLYGHGDPSQRNSFNGRHEYLIPAFDVGPLNVGKSSTESAQRDRKAIDVAHIVRAASPAWAGYWLAGDKTCGMLACDYANYTRFTYSDVGPGPGQWNSGLKQMLTFAKPGAMSLGREYGWALMLQAGAIHILEGGQEERWIIRNTKEMLRIRRLGAAPNGIAQCGGYGSIQGAWDPFEGGGGAVPKTVKIAQSFEAPILWRGERAAMRAVGRQDTDAWELQLMSRGARNLYLNPKVSKNGVPMKYVGVTDASGKLLETLQQGWNTKDSQYGDSTHVTAMLAELARDDEYWYDVLCAGKTPEARAKDFEKLILTPGSGVMPNWYVEAWTLLRRQ